MKVYSLEEAVRAQKALREAAGLGDEQFPVEAFVGMISDEIEELRKRGKSDKQIAELIESSSKIKISAAEIEQHYAPPEQRHPS